MTIRYKLFVLPAIALSLSISTCFSQTRPDTIQGIILNITTGEAIGNATVRLPGNEAHTLSDEDGRFALPIPPGTRRDSIYISHIGYQPIAIAFNRSDTGRQVIRMTAKVKQLSEVVVTSMNPLDLIRKAIEKIPDNYPTTPYQTNGFYRISCTKEKNVIDLSQAVFSIYNESYARKNKQLKVVKVRVDKDLTVFNGNDIDFDIKPSEIMDYDFVANVDESGILSKQGLKEYDFSFNGLTRYNGKKAYEIRFDQKDGIKKPLYQGKMILDAQSLAFLEFDVQLSKKGIKYWGLGFLETLVMHILRLNLKMLSDSVTISYRQYGGKYYIDHVHDHSAAHMYGGKKAFELNPVRIRLNYLVTSIDTTGAMPYAKNDVVRQSRSLGTLSPDINTDSADVYWKDYDLIQPEYKIDSVAKMIRAKNETLNYKAVLEKQLPKYNKDKVARIDSILSFYHQKHQFSGAALVKYEGKVIYEKAFGMADMAKQLPNTPQTQFRIGSMAKQFTAMLIMQLANEHKLDLQDSAGKYIPGYLNGRVTIQQLLTHQSGVPNYTETMDYIGKIFTRTYSLDELVTQFCSDSLDFEPGTEFNYSNSGFVVLADIVEKVTGRKLGDVLKERIFIPAGMKNTSFGTLPHNDSIAIGYMNDEPELTYPLENVAGAGGITSTVEDLLSWNDALSSNKLLPKAQMDELFKPRVEWKEWDAWYGYGWMIDRLQFKAAKKHTIQYHPGTELGLYAMLARQPDKDIVIILLHNYGDFPRFEITDLILSELN